MTNDVFTVDDIKRAMVQLEQAKIPSFDGHYSFPVHPRQAVDIRIYLGEWKTYGEKILAQSLLEHERRRESLGKRGFVTADEIRERVRKVSDRSDT